VMYLHFIWSFLRHVWAKWRGYEIIASPDVQSMRFKRCANCRYNDEGQCRLCKCLVLAKTIMSLEECPADPPRWGPEWRRKRLDRKP